ncbi:MAG: polysaccharide biosynthesis/export family protein [Elusimicrobiota bacterium]
MPTLRSLTAVGAAWLLLAGCGGVAFRVGDDAPAETPATTNPPAATAERPAATAQEEEAAIRSALEFVEAQKKSYQISPAELLEITVYQEDDLNRTVRVSPDGTISLPLAGAVKVGGLGVTEAAQAIHDKLKRFVINPQVSVFIKEYGNKQVYVLGQVKNPGSYPLPTEAPLTVIEAISLAGGFTEYASIDRTRVIRKSPDSSRAFMIEVSAIMKRGDKSKDMQLKTNDVIFVPESFF